MNRFLIFVFAVLPIFLFAQFGVNIVNVTTNDLVYDSQTDRIYVTIPSSNGSNGNSIGVINPHTYTLENTIFIGSEPSVMAISDDGQFIYTGFSGTSTVRKFEVATQTAGLQFSLGSDDFTGSYYVEDIEVMPENPNTIAVSRRNNGFSPRHEGVAIYDDGVMRQNTTPDHTGSNKIEFTSPNALVGYNNETSEFGIRRMAVNNSGVSVVGVSDNVLSGYGLDFMYHDNRMYGTNGVVVDTSNAMFVAGQFANVRGPAVYDAYAEKVCYASYDNAGNITFQRFNTLTFLIEDSLPISMAYGNVKNVITCGNGCYAFNSSDNKVVIIHDESMATFNLHHNNFKIYPNPTTEYVYFDDLNQVKKIFLYDINGKLVDQLESSFNKISLRHLPSGVYFLNVYFKNGEIAKEKIIKK